MTPAPYVLPVEGSLAEAWSLMQLHDVRHIPLCRNGSPAGLISEVDVANIDTWRGNVDMAKIPLKLLARLSDFTVRIHDTVEDACEKLEKSRLTGVVVTDGLHVAGVFTTTDALRALRFFYRRAC